MRCQYNPCKTTNKQCKRTISKGTYCWQHINIPPYVPTPKEEALIDVTDQFLTIASIALGIVGIGSRITWKALGKAIKRVAKGKRVKTGIKNVIKRIYHSSSVYRYNQKVSLISKFQRELKVAYRRRYYLRKKINTLEKAVEKAETQWGRKRAEELLNKARKKLDEVEWDIAVLKTNISDLKAQIRYGVKY